jgi:hypothetical protein
MDSAKQSLLEKKEELVEGQFLATRFIYSREAVFRASCKTAGLDELMDNLVTTYLTPILNYMHDLQIKDTVVSGAKDQTRNFDGLLNLIMQTKADFKQKKNHLYLPRH